jgi:hypothetical protein
MCIHEKAAATMLNNISMLLTGLPGVPHHALAIFLSALFFKVQEGKPLLRFY